MAATGFSPVFLYASGTTGNIPSASNLTNTANGSEIALNYFDGKLFYKNASNSVVTVPLLQSSGSQNGWLSSTDWTTFNGKAPAFTYTSGYIPFGQGTTTPNQSSNLFWDNTNGRLGIGTNLPATSLHLERGDGYLNGIAFGHPNWNGTYYAGISGTVIDGANNTRGYMSFGIRVNSTDAALTTAMQIGYTGGVSIGNTTDPGATNLSVTGFVSANLLSGSTAQVTSGSLGGYYKLGADTNANSRPWLVLSNVSAYGDMAFQQGSTNSGGTYTTRLYLSASAGLSVNSSTDPGAGNLTISGATATKASGTTWANPSDVRLKENIKNFTKGLVELLQVRPCTWEYNGKGGTIAGTKGIGVIADEIENVLPDSVDTYMGKLDSDNEEPIKRFDATEITWLLVNAVKQLSYEINELKGNK